ncbi:Fic family protein [Adlercreutzia caecimuris]|uniref:Fic family protein n=1 Tax=Adlercreutzia caecimuris TaxID=671266 RepID=UPI001C3E8A03|nr:Fic/DOC family N-terminal domain-containing protein [Adlercreutzia caecimuris]
MPVQYHQGKFPPLALDWGEIAGPLAEASSAVARYDSFLGIIPNPDILVAPLMVQEAVTSSRIEGTRATVGDVLVYEAGKTDVDPSKMNDIQEVVNYQRAVAQAAALMKDIPLSGRVLKAAHETLLKNVRGRFKSPGQYRKDQNWIGVNNRIEEARYVPIAPENLDDAMAKWESYVNESKDPTLVKTAIAHAEFESIHPFLDGNGRIGRIAVPLMLWSDGLISNPCFYLSEFFEHRNDEYQDRLLAVSRDGDWTGWCVFFLEAIKAQAIDNNEKANQIFDLYERTRTALLDRTGSKYVDRIVEAMFYAAIFPANIFSGIEGVSDKTGQRMIKALKEMGVIREIIPHSGKRAAIVAFTELLEITEGIKL